MTSKPKWMSIASFSVLALALTATAPQARAENLLDMLFGGGVKKTRERDFPPPPPKPAPQAARKAVAAPRITGPTYNTYKADSLVRVDFSPLTNVATAVSVAAAGAALRFDEALAGLDAFDLFAEKDVAAAITGYYQQNRAFVWIDADGPNARAVEAMRVLSEAGSHGFDPADYLVAVPTGVTQTDPAMRRNELVRFEMTLSARVLRYVSDAVRGRIDPNRISGYYDFPAKPLDLASALKTLAQSMNLRADLEAFHPQMPEYQALRVELEALEASQAEEVTVDPKLLLKPGEASPELPKLLGLVARNLDDEMGGAYGELLWHAGSTEFYSENLVPVIKAVQQRAGIKADGVLGPRTVNVIAGTSKADRIEKVRVALEQLRWLPADLGATRVFINQPAYTASYIEDGAEKLNMRVVIGAPSTQTSFFYDEIEQVDYNPYWGVPQSIIVNEMLPRLRRDPGYLDRAGYEVTDSKGKRIPSSSINWGQYGANVPYAVRQTPSEANALGELKILFPNKHAIYMHDTPSKSFFARDSRALSHGCIRLQDPRGMAAAVLGTSVDHVAEKLKRGHSSEKVSRKIPVYVAYFTAWPSASGTIDFFADVYERDVKLKLAIDATEAARAPRS